MSGVDKEQKIKTIKQELKKHLVQQLSLEDIDPEEIGDAAPLFGEGLGLDSLDAVEIVVILQRHYGIEMKDAEMGRSVFESVNTLAEYIYEHGK